MPKEQHILLSVLHPKDYLMQLQVVRNLADRSSYRAEEIGAELNRQLRQASDSMAEQTQVSQDAFQVRILLKSKIAACVLKFACSMVADMQAGCMQEWKGLMSGILSEEANKMQADLDHASITVAAWQQQSAGMQKH